MTTRPHHKFWPRRLPHAIHPPVTPLWDNLAISARRYPDKAAIVFFGREFRYAEVMHLAGRLAARLHELGVRKGDRVVLNMQNCPQLVIAHFAILRANAVVVPVNPMNRAEELKHYITDPDAKLAITTADLAAEFARASDGLPEGEGLAHLIVSEFTDCMPDDLSGAQIPPTWNDWLLTRHALPGLRGGKVHTWTDALACAGAPPEPQVGPTGPGRAALHQRHHGPAQGLHAHARQHHAQRRGQLPVGQCIA
jgi:fatty-acyl-CoA synthase